MTRALRYIWIVGSAIVGILLFLLASTSENTAFFDQNYSWLLALNILVAIALLALVILMLTRLYKRYRRGKFGSRLMTRLVLLFALIGILPGAVIYAVSVQFVSRSIESWFDLSVESALESGVKLGRVVLESSLSDLHTLAERSVSELSSLSPSEQSLFLSRLQDKKEGLEASIVDSNGHLVAASYDNLTKLIPDAPKQAMLQQARLTTRYAAIEGEIDSPETVDYEENGLQLRVIIKIPRTQINASLQSESYFLQLLQPVPNSLATNAEALRVAYSEYQVRSLSRSGLRKIYIVTLTLTLLLAIFSAIVAAVQIASNLARPLLLLAEGTKAVAGGNLSPRPIVSSSDELGTLTQSFNIMTQQLADARELAEHSRTDLETAKAYLESVLANMSAGVIVLDHQFRLVSCNEPVTRILQQNLNEYIGQELSQIQNLESFSATVIKMFSEQHVQIAARGALPEDMHWQQQIEISRHLDHSEQEHHIMLLARGSCLPVQGQTGYIVVFDDITDIISAQRSLAWGEVARRLAHEIKNPLTPIQLSAERLQMKLGDKLDEPEAALLRKSTETIVNQVASMKQMVDDFRNYAKTPPALLKSLDLNKLIEEIVHLYSGDESHKIIHMRLEPNLPRVMGDKIQLRQVIHNLLQNAQDAILEYETSDITWTPCIEVSTEIVSYQDASNKPCIAVRLTVLDNGVGFSQKILAHIFEPYITTKERGTGLGMALVKKIVDDHRGRIDVQNRTDINGAKISILLLQLEQTEKIADIKSV